MNQPHGFTSPPGMPQAQLSFDPQTIEQGKTLAYLSYASYFVGLPIWLIPIIQKDNAFSLYHAKQAGASYILGMGVAMIIAVIAVITCGFGALLFPLALFPLITSIHGLILVSHGEVREPALVFGIGDKLFTSIQPKPPVT